MTLALHPSYRVGLRHAVIHRKSAALASNWAIVIRRERRFQVLQRCIAEALRVALPTLRFYDDVPCEQLTSLVRLDLANTLVEGLQSGLKGVGSDPKSVRPKNRIARKIVQSRH
jgi:hypothetical protein